MSTKREWITDRSNRPVGLDRDNVVEVVGEGPGKTFVLTRSGGKYWLRAEFAEVYAWWKGEEVSV